MKNSTARLLRSVIKLVIAVGVPALILGSWIFRHHYSPAEMLREYFVLIQVLMGAALGATATHAFSGVKSPSLLLLGETVLGAFLGGWLCRLIFGLIAKIVFKLGVVIAAVICAGLILASFVVGASVSLSLYEDKVQRASEIIYKSQNTNVSEDLKEFRNSDGKDALNEAKRRIGHAIK